MRKTHRYLFFIWWLHSLTAMGSRLCYDGYRVPLLHLHAEIGLAPAVPRLGKPVDQRLKWMSGWRASSVGTTETYGAALNERLSPVVGQLKQEVRDGKIDQVKVLAAPDSNFVESLLGPGATKTDIEKLKYLMASRKGVSDLGAWSEPLRFIQEVRRQNASRHEDAPPAIKIESEKDLVRIYDRYLAKEKLPLEDLVTKFSVALVAARHAVSADVDGYGKIGQSADRFSISLSKLQAMNPKLAQRAKELAGQERTVTIGGKKFAAAQLQITADQEVQFRYPSPGDKEQFFAAVEREVQEILTSIKNNDKVNAYHRTVLLLHAITNVVPFEKGSSSLGEMTARVLLEVADIKMGAIKPGNGFDLNAWLSSPEIYDAEFPSLFVSEGDKFVWEN